MIKRLRTRQRNLKAGARASGIVDALDDKEYTGSLVTLLQAGTDFVRNNSRKAWRKVGDGLV